MGRRRILVGLVAIALVMAPATAAQGHTFRPHIGRAWGIVPPPSEVAAGVREPAVFHGGVVMHGVTIHTVFWAGPGAAFGGPPAAGAPGYEQLIQRFLGDVSAAPGGVFSILDEYGDTRGSGTDALRYVPASDSIDDTHAYPPLGRQCVSPGGAVTCVTDLEVQRELDRVITAHRGTRGLHDLWVMLLPGSVDECISPGECGTSAFAGYHSLSDLGQGATVYAVIIDPAIEAPPVPGADPEGNPEAESAADTTAHEVVEAVTDPEGTGWMDANGGEVGDKCETYFGTPLGYSANGSPYDQVLNAHPYLVQTMWSNTAQGCVMRARPAAPPSLAHVSLTQYSPVLRGSIGRAGVSVDAALLRGGVPMAYASARTDARGRWRAVLRLGGFGRVMPVGDDRDVLAITYGRTLDLIATGEGGNPFTQSGFTSWADLDYGYAVRRSSVSIAPCSQTGVLTLRAGGRTLGSPVTACQTETDVAPVASPPLGPASRVFLTSTDNRASTPRNPLGALVSLTVALGEPGAISAGGNPRVLLDVTGFPACAADLSTQRVRCSGLVGGARYRLAGKTARADGLGMATFAGASGRVWVRGGAALALTNRVGRTITVLHVAHLRVALRGDGHTVVGGRCEPGAYLSGPARGPSSGSAGGDAVCPTDGDARAYSGAGFVQSDPFSAGLTRTEVPVLGVTSPIPGETLYGPFIAFAQPAPSYGARVTLAIVRRGSRHVLRRYAGLQRARGVSVTGLPRGVYTAVWTVTDLNGDTRTTQSPFVEQSSP